MRLFAERPKPNLAALAADLRALYTVPDDLPDSFSKAFARLDSSDHQKRHEGSRARNPGPPNSASKVEQV
jgi:hypothetical protein